MQQSSEKPQKHHITPEQGLGFYPISNVQYDVMHVITQKSQALRAYDNYIRDSMPNPELRQVFEAIMADERKHIDELKRFIGNA